MSTREAQDAMPDKASIQATVAMFDAVAHPTRLLVLLALGRRGPLTVSELQDLAGIEQSAMSHQLRLLREARLVRAEPRGRQVVYSLDDHHVAHIVEDALLHAREVDPANEP